MTAVEIPTPTTSRIFPGPTGKLVYTSDENGDTIPDFSHAGYMGGGVAIPDIPAAETVRAVEGDASAMIQAANGIVH